MKKKFKVGEIVYLVTDPDQNPRIVTGILERATHFVYFVRLGSEDETDHFDIELCDTKDYKK